MNSVQDSSNEVAEVIDENDGPNDLHSVNSVQVSSNEVIEVMDENW